MSNKYPNQAVTPFPQGVVGAGGEKPPATRFGSVAYDVQHIDPKAFGSFFDTVYYAFVLHF